MINKETNSMTASESNVHDIPDDYLRVPLAGGKRSFVAKLTFDEALKEVGASNFYQIRAFIFFSL
jgi:hypothetical protein